LRRKKGPFLGGGRKGGSRSFLFLREKRSILYVVKRGGFVFPFGEEGEGASHFAWREKR